MILVDSSVWIDYFRGSITSQTEKLDQLLGNEPLAIGDLILTELLQGFSSERAFHAALEMLTALPSPDYGAIQQPAGPDIRHTSFREVPLPGANGDTQSRNFDPNRVIAPVLVSCRGRISEDVLVTPIRINSVEYFFRTAFRPFERLTSRVPGEPLKIEFPTVGPTHILVWHRGSPGDTTASPSN